MPGFSTECVSNAHDACSDRDCRCQCHPRVQAMVQKSAPKNGHKRSRKEVPSTEPEIACPQCGTKSKASDNFCRKDGARLMVGKPCVRCNALGDADDLFCFACGWKYGEALPVAEEVPQLTREQQIERIKKIAEARGIDPSRVDALLQETIV